VLVDEVMVIDADSHVTEPPDLWSSRVGRELIEQAPRVVRDEKHKFDRWVMDGRRLGGVAASAAAGWKEPLPSYPPTLDEAHPGAWNPTERLRVLDEYGIWAQVLFPNLLGFSQFAFFSLKEPLRTECIKAYNDFIAEFASEDPRRFVPIMVVPYWDLEGAISEIKRGMSRGHRGLLMPARFEKVGLPGFSDPHWDGLYNLAQSEGLSINYHAAFSSILTEAELKSITSQNLKTQDSVDFAKGGGYIALDAMGTVGDLLMSGLCDRFPDLKFVSVESGAGWIPYFLESLDFQWLSCGLRDRMPNASLPSECYFRQVYGTFSFEHATLVSQADVLQNNVMFSTDFPHPASLAPGPSSPVPHPREVIERLSVCRPEVTQKLLHDNAAALYGLQPIK